MICLQTVKKFCNGNISDIENYDLAIKDTEKCWHCHHRMEIQPDGVRLKRKWMIEHGIYFNVDPVMLIFLTESEHRRIHMAGREITERAREAARENGRKGPHDHFRGHHHSKESIEKFSSKIRGRKLVMIDGRRHYVKPSETNN